MLALGVTLTLLFKNGFRLLFTSGWAYLKLTEAA